MAPVVSATSVTATDNGASHAVATFTGTSPSYLVNDNDTVATGAAFTDTDYTSRNRVALLGHDRRDRASSAGTARAVVGQTVQFNGVAFQVVGLLGAKGSTGPQDQDDRVVAPLTAVQDTLTGYGNVSSISVKATSAGTVDAAQAEVDGHPRRPPPRHRRRPGLLDLQPELDPGRRHLRHVDVHPAAGRRRRDLAAGRAASAS